MEADQHTQAQYLRLWSQIYRSAPLNNSSYAKRNGVGQPFWALICKLFVDKHFQRQIALQLNSASWIWCNFGWFQGAFFNSLKHSLKCICKTKCICFKRSFLWKKFLKVWQETQSPFTSLLDKQVSWSQTLTLWCYRTSGKIREVLLFSSFFAFPK